MLLAAPIPGSIHEFLHPERWQCSIVLPLPRDCIEWMGLAGESLLGCPALGEEDLDSLQELATEAVVGAGNKLSPGLPLLNSTHASFSYICLE